MFLLGGLHHFFPIHSIVLALQHGHVPTKIHTLMSTSRSSSGADAGVHLYLRGSPGSAGDCDFPEIHREREPDLAFQPSIFTTFLFVCQRQHLYKINIHAKGTLMTRQQTLVPIGLGYWPRDGRRGGERPAEKGTGVSEI